MTRIKICGITNLDDARVAVEAGADYLGFILFAKSPRYVEPETVRAILAALGAAGHPVQGIGVFVNHPIDDVARILEATGLTYAQLHGDETVETVATLAGRGFKALRPTAVEDLTQAAAFAAQAGAEGPQLMVDAYSPTAYGGTGHRADWSLAQQAAAQTARLLLAGGLTPENVGDAVRHVAPWGVDVSSGVEASPGRKDHAKMRAFIAAARAATRPINSRSPAG